MSTSNNTVSIQGERSTSKLTPGVVCKAQWRHAFAGNVYQRSVNGVVYWVAVLECVCGTVRTTRYVPHSWEQVGQHKYWRPEKSDYPDDLTHEECRVLWLNSILTTAMEGSGL